MFETMAIFREILRENNMMLTPASLFRVDLRTLAMTLRALTFSNQGDSVTSSETIQVDESSTRNLQSVKSEGTYTTITSTNTINSAAEFNIWPNNENSALNDESATLNSERTTSVTLEHRTIQESSVTQRESSNMLSDELLTSNIMHDETTRHVTSTTEVEALPKSSKEHKEYDENMEEMSLTEELHQVLDFKTAEVRTSIFTEGMYGYTADTKTSSEVDWNKVSDTAHKDDSDKTAEIQATNNYIDNTSRTKREAIVDETISPSYPHESESGQGLTSDMEEIDDTEIAQDSEISMYQIDETKEDDQFYPLEMSSYLEGHPLGTFWDTSSVFNPNTQPRVFGDRTANVQNNPSSSFLPDIEDMQPSETMIGSQTTRYVGYKFNPESTERMTGSFNCRMSSSPDHTMSSMSSDQNGFSSYFNIMGTVQGSGLAQNLQSLNNRASLDSSHFFVYSLDDMRNSRDSSPTQTFSFNAAASSSSHGDSYPTGLVLTPGTTFEQHLSESAITPRYNSDFPNWWLSDSASSENWSNRLSSANLPVPTETNIFSEQFPTETPKNQTVAPTNSKPNPTPAFQIPTLGGSCSRDYPEVVFRVLRAIENIPQTHYCSCPHFVCKIPPPPVLPPIPPPFFKKPGIRYMLTKILYRDFVRKRRIMWEQAAMWDNTNVTHGP